jgi:hypothetical protein
MERSDGKSNFSYLMVAEESLLYLCIEIHAFGMVRKFIAVTLLLIFTVETIGFTIRHHFCSVGHSDEITAINGFRSDVSDEEGCCCANEPRGSDAAQSATEISLVPQPCCTEIAAYLKFEFSSNLPATFLKVLEHPFSAIQLFGLTGIFEKESFSLITPHYSYFSPPLSGTDFLIFSHQRKIPAPCC